MKELPIEEKAKAYDGAVDRVKQLLSRCANDRDRKTIIYRAEDIEQIFPELKESDERIRKDILAFIIREGQHSDKYKWHEWIDWLKKQGEQKQDPCEHCDNVMLNCHNFPCIKKRAYEQGKSVFEVSDENPTVVQTTIVQEKDSASIEPKFKVGDWTVSKLDKKARQISEVHFDEYNSYYVVNEKSVNLEEYDRLHHLWTIDDARDGDILNSPTSHRIWIYKDNEHYYAFINTSYAIKNIVTNGSMIIPNDACPTTKEQRDLLFQRMQEAGYEWDKLKREVKKIERKSIDNPKFKIGDWIVDNCGCVWKIEGIINQLYILEGIDGGWSRPTIEWVNKTFHLWTIADAQNGDVLQLGDVTAIFKELIDNENCKCYCSVCDELFEIPSQEDDYGCQNATPATKEQCDFLFQKIKEEGYEWDKKKLKKVEKNPAWSEEDEEMYGRALAMIEWYSGEYEDKSRLISDWLKSIKDRVQPQPKQEWSEEDEDMIDNIIDYLRPMPIFFESTKGKSGKEYTQEFVKEAINWLKSLRPQHTWKPSDKQMEILSIYADQNNTHGSVLTSLYNDLKKL